MLLITMNKLMGYNHNGTVVNLPGAHRERDTAVEDDGHGAAILSVKSQVKLKPVWLSKTTSEGRLRSKHPAHITNFRQYTSKVKMSLVLVYHN